MRSIGLVILFLGAFMVYITARGKAPDSLNAIFNTTAFSPSNAASWGGGGATLKTLPDGTIDPDAKVELEPSIAERLFGNSKTSATTSSFYAPTTALKVTSQFGTRELNGKEETHKGIDLGGSGSGGAPVYSIESGKVIFAGKASGYGNAVYIQHPDGLLSKYGHLDPWINVKTGDTVMGGQQIASIGKGIVGRSTGEHLHFQVEKGGVPINPLDIISKVVKQG